jgi:Flp pilus assembly protein TadB
MATKPRTELLLLMVVLVVVIVVAVVVVPLLFAHVLIPFTYSFRLFMNPLVARNGELTRRLIEDVSRAIVGDVALLRSGFPLHLPAHESYRED